MTPDQRAVIAEYVYFKEQLAGPHFGPPAPRITRIEARDGNLKIFGKNLRGVRAIHVANDRVPRARFKITDGVDPYIEAQLSNGSVAGSVTVLTTGGVATGQLSVADSGAAGGTSPSPPADSPGEQPSGEAEDNASEQPSSEG